MSSPVFVPVNYPGFGPMLTQDQISTTEPSTPSITLISGKVITNPASTAPAGNDCLPYNCGADSQNQAAIQWCSQWGHVGVYACSSPQCDPVRSLLACAPAPAPAPPPVPPPPPSVLMSPSLAVPNLTPQNVVQPLPDITATVKPTPIPTAQCSLWCDLNAAIAANPLMAVLILAGGAFLLWPRGRA